MPARGRLDSGSSPEHVLYSGPVPAPIAVVVGLGSGSSAAHRLYSGLVPEPSAPRHHRTACAARPMSFHFNSDLKKAFV